MNVMKLFKVSELLKTDGELGVEVEVEGRRLPQHSKLWKGEYDGSLKYDHSREFVLRKPLTLLGVYQAVKELGQEFKDNRTVVDDSIRAGVHVHVNMQDSTKNELFNLITLWAVFEDVLLDRCGAYRKGNLFCYPLSRSDNVWEVMMKAGGDSRYLHNFASDEYRYCAINVASLHKYGSLEFRAMRTPRNVSEIYQWAKLLLSMKKFSAKFDNPIHMLNKLDEVGIDKFYDMVFKGFDNYLTRSKDLGKRINDGYLIANAIAYSSDWVVECEKKPHAGPYFGGFAFDDA